MAHQIDFTTGQAAIAYATDTDVPWHGLGQTVDPEASVEVWQKAAQLEWRALKAEVQFDSTVTNQCESFADKHVLYRSDCGAPLSVVSSDYQVVQPADILNFFGALAEAKQFRIETVGALMNGRRIWALGRVGKNARILDDEVAPTCCWRPPTTARWRPWRGSRRFGSCATTRCRPPCATGMRSVR